MEQRNSEQKTAQILYITIILVLLIMAITVGLVSAANKAKEPLVTTADATASSGTQTTQRFPAVTTERTTAITTVATTETTTATTTTAATTKAPKPVNAEPQKVPLPTFYMPANGNISAEFSIDVLVYSNTMEDYRTHNGIDICAAAGSAVCVAANGVVSEVYEHPMMGYTVVISHDGDAETVYQNLDDDITVSVGDIVKSGDVIGAVGESAIIEIAEEPHLHFEMCIAGERVNPLDYIEPSSQTMSYEE